ncbi:carbon-nitrogen hydrolase family protein [Desulfitobacterium sp. Sab5]|uniref:carbon-nitrogen hydrolase family protein n=1 Tax=Desulfitobacterium nosdiversum TaxID=3375356 RepID=UPI003CEA2A00
MIISSLQMNIIKNNKDKNLLKVEELIGNNKVDLVVLPELFSTGYFYDTSSQLWEIAEEIPNGITTQKLISIAGKAGCHLVGTIVEKDNDRLFITSEIIGPSGYIGKHRKRHLTDDEVALYSCGESSDVYEINGCKIGIVTCFEGWFPEITRELILKGAQVICHSALITSERTFDIMRIRAIENKVYVIISNGINTETYKNRSITFKGDSRIIDYIGNILVNAGQEEKIILAEIHENETLIKNLDDCHDLISEIKKHNY